MKDKESKISFLTKLISHVENKIGTSIDLNPSKVVAGLETDKTRRFFQLFVLAATTRPRNFDSEQNNNIGSDSDFKYVDRDPYPTQKSDTMHKVEFSTSATHKLEETKSDLSTTNNGQATNSESPSKAKEERELQDNIREENRIPVCKVEEAIPTKDDVRDYISPSKKPVDPNMDSKEDCSNTETLDSAHDAKQHCQDSEIMVMKRSPSASVNTMSPDNKDNPKTQNQSLSKLFFGVEDSEVEEQSDLTQRPKTARRRPPKIKDNKMDDQTYHLQYNGEKPFIFRDKDECDTNLKQTDTRYVKRIVMSSSTFIGAF